MSFLCFWQIPMSVRLPHHSQVFPVATKIIRCKVPPGRYLRIKRQVGRWRFRGVLCLMMENITTLVDCLGWRHSMLWIFAVKLGLVTALFFCVLEMSHPSIYSKSTVLLPSLDCGNLQKHGWGRKISFPHAIKLYFIPMLFELLWNFNFACRMSGQCVIVPT